MVRNIDNRQALSINSNFFTDCRSIPPTNHYPLSYFGMQTQPFGLSIIYFQKSMKAIILKMILLVTWIMSISCEGTETIATDPAITGSWEWKQSTGGISGDVQTPASTGMNIRIDVGSGLVKRFVNGAFESEESYTLEIKSSIFGGNREMIIIEGQPDQSFQVNGNRLILIEECADCYEKTFIKL